LASSADEPDLIVVADERWERVKDILHQAMQLAEEPRSRFLDEACFSDAAMRAEVESLLAADADARPGFLPSRSYSGASNQNAAGVCYIDALAPGQIFEQRFALLRTLGEGGMGQVWLADQISPVRRQVALKLIRAGMYDTSVVQRFQSERQSLAIMDHPCIAKVFDAGTTAQGQPYFVMEYVPGPPITDYCDQHTLAIPERLELFIRACDGVQHAHQKAVIHRDLKPPNILVVEVDGKPMPRIIDFGLAKPANPKLAGEALFTMLGTFVGTPGYMSPEQADLDVTDIDTRTDVYSLGVVLYVLLTGRQPFDAKSGGKLPLAELLRQLREEEPPFPSAKISTARDESAANCTARGTEPKQLARLLRGDLDWITMKALERDRRRRYGAPSELAADLRRYLDHEPVMARPASAGYRFRKYARRHRVAVGVAAGLMGLLAAFSVLQAFELRRVTRERDRANLERDRANQERDRATRITDFMTGMFKVSDPSEARGNSVTAREILDKASAEVGKGLAQDSEVQSQMLHVMASTYLNLGIYARAHTLANSAFETRLSMHGADDSRTLASMTQLGWILDRQGRDGEAEALERRALAVERRVLGPENTLTLETMDHLAVIMGDEGHYDEQERLARQVIETATRTLGPESAQALQSTNHLAGALWNEARYAEAEQQYRRLLDTDRRVLGPDHPQTLSAAISLAVAVASQGRGAEAERLYREVWATQQRVLGPEHQFTVLTMADLAALLIDQGRLQEGEELCRKVLEIRLRTLGPEHPDTLISKLNLADVLLNEDHVREAEILQRDTLAVQVRVLGPENPNTLDSQTNLAAILIRERRYAEAEQIAAGTFEAELRLRGPQHDATIDALRQLGRAMAYRRRYAEANRLFRDLIDKQNGAASADNRWSVWYAFACVAVAANHTDDALRYLREAVNRGYTGADALQADHDLKDLRDNPQFQQIVARLRTPRPQGT
jgi:non-specific serine/threonine protein kinase/serine/threonine-protein kinase